MAHLNSFDSFKTRKSINNKERSKNKINNKEINLSSFIIDENSENAIVIEVRYNDVYVLYNDEIILSHIRQDLNIIANQVLFPGDKVIIVCNNNNYIIQNLIKRTSLLSRLKKDSTRNNDIGLNKNIASNIDLAVIVVTCAEPPLHAKFIDRYLMVLQNSNIKPIIVLNKCDLKTDEDKLLEVYKNLNIKVIETSTYLKTGIDDLKQELKNKQAIFVGNSGVGKSSLISAIMDDDSVKVGSVSEKSKRGRHTTTTSKYYIWDTNSSIIDTPGIRSLDVSTFTPGEVQEYFPEISKYKNTCKYSDCLHYHENEEDCTIKKYVNSNLINKDRYDSYIRIISSIMEDK